MIADGKKWHYLAVKILSALIRGITSKDDGDFYCLNCFYLQQKMHLKNTKMFAKSTTTAM